MTSLARIAIWVFFALALDCVFAGYGKPQGSYTVYSQTTLNCILTSCNNAQFTPEATLSYAFPFRTMGQQNVSGSVTWNGVVYGDAIASMNWKGYGNHYPFGDWEVRATFNGGIGTVVENFYCFRSCGDHSNHDGEVVITQ